MGLVFSCPWQAKPLPWHKKLFKIGCLPTSHLRLPSVPIMPFLLLSHGSSHHCFRILPFDPFMLLSMLFPLPRMFFLLLHVATDSQESIQIQPFRCPFPPPASNIFIGYLLQTRSHFYDSTYLLMVLYLQQTGNSLEADGDILVMCVSPAQGWHLEPVNDK